jgi:3-deoxy-D-manno-octulosonate 8-phosphate phosphatase (KDO 8-P phosphatase)
VDHVVTTARSVDASELARRAARVRLVVSDVDGVLTDAGVYYSERGEELKRFNVRDGMGVERLRGVGIRTAFLTKETSPSVRARARKLALEHTWLGVADKRAHLPVVLSETGLTLAEIAYIGDDVNDLAIIEAIATEGLTAAPADAMDAVARVVHHRVAARGGHGAFREFADWILEHATPKGGAT